MAFRTSPNLGPDVDQFDTAWWFDLNLPAGKGSPLNGNPELGSDGHYYVKVIAGAAFATAGTDLVINETTWVATAGSGGYETPVAAIPAGAEFYARSIALPQ